MDSAELIKEVNIYSCKINLLYGEWAKRKGLSLYSMMVLDAVAQSQPCTQKQISEQWLLPKQTVHAVIKEMQARGIIRLTPGRNQKEKLVSFTEAGTDAYQEMMVSTNRLENRIVEEIGESDCLAVLHAFRRYADIFEKELQRDEP